MGSLEITRRMPVHIPATGTTTETAGRSHEATLAGTLTVPASTQACVIFVHGSSKASARQRQVAAALEAAGFATLIIDLLTEVERREDAISGRYRFDIGLLASRLVATTEWLSANQPAARNGMIGYFGTSTGAAAALVAACSLAGAISAIACLSGRPDLAGPFLERVETPTLLLVGSNDTNVINLNDRARSEMRRAEQQLVLIPGAGHLFEETGTMDRAIEQAVGWFRRHLQPGHRRSSPPVDHPDLSQYPRDVSPPLDG